MPPGISDATVPNPLFNLTPAATVDEGNNWVNISWGPLSMTNPTVVGGTNGNYVGGNPLGNYGIASGSSAAGRIGQGSANYVDASAYDFFDKPRKPGAVDGGAVQRSGNGTRDGSGVERHRDHIGVNYLYVLIQGCGTTVWH